MTKITEHEIEFEFPYRLDGHDVAYFDCLVKVRVDWGQKPMHYPPPGDPGYGPELDKVSGLKVDAGRAGWCMPDQALATKIYDYLSTPHMQAWLINRAEEDR